MHRCPGRWECPGHSLFPRPTAGEFMPSPSLRDDALAVWRAGVAAVDSALLTSRAVSQWRGGLRFADAHWIPQPDSRILIVGAGKAGAGMVRGALAGLSEDWTRQVSGWVNVPDNCVPPPDEAATIPVHLHPARPAGLNEPTDAGVRGTREILDRVGQLRPHDLCLVLISGGGSALLPAPVAGISLADKQLVTRTLSRAGADIHQLNTVRRALSQIKGGGLLRACRAGTLISLIISDVAGDPLETIASGPTVPIAPDPQAAWKLVEQFFSLAREQVPPAVKKMLKAATRETAAVASGTTAATQIRFHNVVIGNNRTAVNAAAQEARRRGWRVDSTEWDQAGEAADVGRKFAQSLAQLRAQTPAGSTACFISGGEPTVHITPHAGPQQGGRNQELILAAACELLRRPVSNFALVSGGTDGEDGPTDAAGASLDAASMKVLKANSHDAEEALRMHNSYPLLDQFGLLLKTGPTHTNVMDLRVGVAGVQGRGSRF